MEQICLSSNAAHRPIRHSWEGQGAFGLAGEVFDFGYYYYSMNFGLDFVDFDYRKSLTSSTNWRQRLNFHHGPFLPYRPCYRGPFLPHVEKQQPGVCRRLWARRSAVR